jgi:hypothetical protein
MLTKLFLAETFRFLLDINVAIAFIFFFEMIKRNFPFIINNDN